MSTYLLLRSADVDTAITIDNEMIADALPTSGFVFDKWSDGVTTANRQVTVNSNLTLTASFKEQTQSGGTGDDEGGVGEY